MGKKWNLIHSSLGATLMKKYFSIGVLLIVLILAPKTVSARDITQEDLRQWTEYALKIGLYEVNSPPKFDWEEESLYYHLGMVSPSANAGNSDIPEGPIREQFTVTLIRKYRNSSRAKRFWQPVLRQVEAKISEMLTVTNTPNLTEDEKWQKLSPLYDEIYQIYQRELNQLAKSEGKESAERIEVAVPCVARPALYPVTIISRPGNGTVYCIPNGEWLLYQHMKKQNCNYHHPHWEVLPQNTELKLFGKHWFKVTWPDGKINDIELRNIKNSGPQIFYPNKVFPGS